MALPTEGSLAPDPNHSRPRPPAREIPGLRNKKAEPTWKDEVRERVKHRKRRTEDVELPLFKESAPTRVALDTSVTPEARSIASHPIAPAVVAPSVDAHQPAPVSKRPYAVTARVASAPSPATTPGEDPMDLPLHPHEPPAEEVSFESQSESVDFEAPPGPTSEAVVEDDAGEWSFDIPATPQTAAPAKAVERPALAAERSMAAAIDVTLLMVLWSVVGYFASRAAHVSVRALLPAWPWLLGYFAFLGLSYAGFFTGTTGQTLGKIAAGLRVVDGDGRPPGYLRAFVRAAAGSLGVLLGFAGTVPIFFDPARRAFHDRLLKTRVIKG
jgi:uncharacterized RDD family membrane protein YckC